MLDARSGLRAGAAEQATHVHRRLCQLTRGVWLEATVPHAPVCVVNEGAVVWYTPYAARYYALNEQLSLIYRSEGTFAALQMFT